MWRLWVSAAARPTLAKNSRDGAPGFLPRTKRVELPPTGPTRAAVPTGTSVHGSHIIGQQEDKGAGAGGAGESSAAEDF
jgi:hypothetical protein